MSISADQLLISMANESLRFEAFIKTVTIQEISLGRIAMLFVYAVIGATSLVSNGLLLLAVLKSRRVSEKYFLLNLVFTDLLMTVICIPGASQKIVSNHWSLGEGLCRLVESAMVSTAAASIFNHTAMILERSIGISTNRLAINSKASRTTSCKMILVVWLVAVSFGSPAAKFSRLTDVGGLMSFSFAPFTNATQLSQMCLQNMNNRIMTVVYDAFSIMLLYVLPLSIIIYSYARIIRTVREVNSQLVHFNNNAAVNRTKKIVRLGATMASIFAVSWLPHHLTMQIRNIMALINGESFGLVAALSTGVDTSIFILIEDAISCLALSNCAVNPIYLFMSCPKFRKIIVCTFRCRQNGGNGGNGGGGTTASGTGAVGRRRIGQDANTIGRQCESAV